MPRCRGSLPELSFRLLVGDQSYIKANLRHHNEHVTRIRIMPERELQVLVCNHDEPSPSKVVIVMNDASCQSVQAEGAFSSQPTRFLNWRSRQRYYNIV